MTALALLAPAPEVARERAERRRRPVPATALLVVGLALVVVPIATGMFSKVAAGQQVLDRFQPHLEVAALDQVHHDLVVLGEGRRAAAATLRDGHVATGRFPGIDAWAGSAGQQIQRRAEHLLAAVQGAVPDYQSVRSIDGFDRIPLMIVAAGLGLAYAGATLLRAERRSYAPVVGLSLAMAAILIGYPLVSGLNARAPAAQRLLSRLQPIVTDADVVQLQRDFVVIVTAEGEVDTTFRAVPTSHAASLTTLRDEWPQISSDLASLVGDLNDSVSDVQALTHLNNVPIHRRGFTVLPWALIAAGATAAALTLTARPRAARVRKVPA